MARMEMYTHDRASGNLTHVISSPSPRGKDAHDGPRHVKIHPNGKVLYCVTEHSGCSLILFDSAFHFLQQTYWTPTKSEQTPWFICLLTRFSPQSCPLNQSGFVETPYLSLPQHLTIQIHRLFSRQLGVENLKTEVGLAFLSSIQMDMSSGLKRSPMGMKRLMALALEEYSDGKHQPQVGKLTPSTYWPNLSIHHLHQTRRQMQRQSGYCLQMTMIGLHHQRVDKVFVCLSGMVGRQTASRRLLRGLYHPPTEKGQ
jgi:hypothetical protein